MVEHLVWRAGSVFDDGDRLARAAFWGHCSLDTIFEFGKGVFEFAVKYYIRGNWILENITESHANTRACI